MSIAPFGFEIYRSAEISLRSAYLALHRSRQIHVQIGVDPKFIQKQFLAVNFPDWSKLTTLKGFFVFSTKKCQFFSFCGHPGSTHFSMVILVDLTGWVILQ
jgi:hypothetical protein